MPHGHCNQMLWILSKQHKNIIKAAAVKPILKDTSPAERHRGITTLSVFSEAKRGALNAISRRHSLPGRRCGAEAILIGFLSFQTRSQCVSLAGLEFAM